MILHSSSLKYNLRINSWLCFILFSFVGGQFLHVSRVYFPSKLTIIIISNLILGSFSATMSLLIGYQFHFVTLCIVLILTDIT